MDKAKTKIAVLHILEATTGGTRRHLVDLATTLDRDAFDVSVLCSTLRDPAFLPDISRMRAAGINVTITAMVRNISPVHDIRAFSQIHAFLRQHRFDIVHTHSSKAGFLGRLAAAAAHVPVIVHTPHVFAFRMDTNPVLRALYRRLEKLAARHTTRFICVSADEKDGAVAAGLAPADRFTVITNGVAMPDRRKPAPIPGYTRRTDEVVIGAVGRLTRQKGHRYLVQAARQVVDRFPNVRFLLAGTGELKPCIESLIRSLALDDNVRIIDVHDNYAPLYAELDIFACPSLWEGMPYALLDAMSHGNAIVATCVGGIPEAVIHDESGLLVPPRTPAALAEAITRCLNDPDLRARLGANAASSAAAHFSLDHMVTQTEELYKDLASLVEPASRP